MDLAVQWFIGNIGLKVLESFFLLSEYEVALCTVEIGLKDFLLFITLVAL